MALRTPRPQEASPSPALRPLGGLRRLGPVCRRVAVAAALLPVAPAGAAWSDPDAASVPSPYDYDASTFARFAELPVDQTLWAAGRVSAYESSRAVDLGLPLGILSIPRLRLEVPVWPGADPLTLDRGLGHIPGTPPPGVVGNVGIAGHRDGYLRVLKDVALGDEIQLETLAGRERFVVELVLIVRPGDVWVLEPTAEPSLTLVTCYPFYFLGKAPHRFIVRATRVAPTTAPAAGTDTQLVSRSKLPDDSDNSRHSTSSSAAGSARP